MIASFFQSLESAGVEYLLISGQAAVLYGAAEFSEDIDLWIEPSSNNVDRFVKVLHKHKARYYKLTPPLQTEYLRGGHGFDFTLPDGKGKEAFLDIMGKPPRISDFSNAKRDAVLMDSEWGALPTIGIRQLIEIKKTQRLPDYDVISKLVLEYFQQLSPRTDAEYLWGIDNIFTLSALSEFFEKYPAAADLPTTSNMLQLEFGKALVSGDVRPKLEEDANQAMSMKITELQAKDRVYWRAVIRELREMRASGKLLREGTLV